MNDDQPNGNPWLRSLLIWGGIFLAMLMVVSMMGSRGDQASASVPYSEFRAKVVEGTVAEVQISEDRIVGKYKNGETFSAVPIPGDAGLTQLLTANGVKYAAKPKEEMSVFTYILIQALPFLLILGVAFFALKQVQKGGGGGAMGFGKSKAKLLTERQGRVTFADVAGIDEAREELEEIVEFLKDPQRFSKLGGQIPKGALLVGSPGTGKTLLARAIAGEAGVPFFTISGSDFVEMFVGVGASRVRDMFEQAKKNAPCIVFIDEIDAVGRHRGARPRQLERRARADAQPAAGRDGRLRGQRGHHHRRRHQPARRARSGAAAPRPVRPAGGGADPRHRRAREDPRGAHEEGSARPGRQRADDRARHPGLLGRRSRQPGQRSGAARRAAQQAPRRHAGVRERQGQGDDGRRAPLDGDDRRREADDRLSRSGPCHRLGQRAGQRPDPQGDDHPARPRARHGHAPARTRHVFLPPRQDAREPVGLDGRPRRRGAGVRLRQGQLRRLVGHLARDGSCPQHGHQVGHVRQARPAAVRGPVRRLSRLWRPTSAR